MSKKRTLLEDGWYKDVSILGLRTKKGEIKEITFMLKPAESDIYELPTFRFVRGRMVQYRPEKK